MSTSLDQLVPLLEQCWRADRFHLSRKLDQLRRRAQQGKPVDRSLAQLEEKLKASCQRVAIRRENLPAINYPPALPVSQRVDDIREAIAAHQVVVVAGETGSGKTTQIPKICLELGRGISGMIGHTQPRRLAARTVASRIAEELQSELGQAVSYQVRFQDTTSPHTYIKLMTDGILLAAIQQDRFLSQYDTIIIDEAHERSLNIDFLLGYLKLLLPKRPDLKLIITSATIDVERFSRHFENAPVVEVSGRSYPVELRYRPQEELSADNDLAEAVFVALEELMAEGCHRRGDVLVFLNGERDIREVARHLRHQELPGAEVLPLYARLSNAEQQRIFDISKRRGWRIVLATNVAETSLTVPGIHFVIDAGTARISRYSYRSKVQRLPIEPISQASANQRSGRCGRVAPGIAIRLYSEQDFIARPEFTEPEIQRTNLAAVILQMLRLGLGEVGKFPFVDRPDNRLVNDGYKLLAELGAVEGQQLTALGRQLSQFSVDPRLARMLLAASGLGCLEEVLILVSVLSIQDPRERPADKQQAADEKHRRFADERSDFVALVNLWGYFEEQRQELSQNQLRKLCQREFLSWMRMREWRELHHQLRLTCRDQGLVFNTEPADYNNLHRALLSGLLSHVACRDRDREYLGTRNRRLRILPGSGLYKKSPPWIVAAEMVETGQLYARTVGRIEPDWLLGINDDVLKRHYSEPHWQPRSGRVVAKERVTLYGLTIRDQHRVHYGTINPAVSREILIREGLVEGGYRGRAAFYRHNQQLIESVRAMEDKARRRDILVGDEVIFEFYDQRLPADITTAKQLESWLKKSGKEADRELRIAQEMLMLSGASGVDEAQFPDQLSWRGLELPLRYHFEPGNAADGVNVVVPLAVLNRLPRYLLEWLVPGLLEEKCVALVKLLPKSTRKQLVPVPETVRRAMAHLERGDVSLLAELAKALQRVSGVQIPVQEWETAELDNYYRMNVCVVDEAGKMLAQGRNLQALTQRFSQQMEDRLEAELEQGFEARASTEWDFGALPREHHFEQGGASVKSYPALVDKGDRVELCLRDSAQLADADSRRGVVRLLLLSLPQIVKGFRSRLLADNQAQLQFAAAGQQRKEWVEEALQAAARDCFHLDESLPRDEAAFRRVLQDNKSQFSDQVEVYGELLAEVLAGFAGISRALKKLKDLSWIQTVSDIHQQLSTLFFPGFIAALTLEQLQQYPRYLQALESRLDKLRGNYPKEKQSLLILQTHQSQLMEQWGEPITALPDNQELLRYHWMLQEFRVSLYAQQLGTREPVSEKRLRAQYQQVLEQQLPSA